MASPPTIEWVSPSAVARLQACGLAESRRRTHSGRSAPSNPITRLGNAAHRVLEWVARSAPELSRRDDAEDLIAARWVAEVEREVEASEAHPLERWYGPPERWPAYGRISAGLRVDGVALAHELAALPIEKRCPEKPMTTSDRTIRGTADLIVAKAEGEVVIIDHKAGEVSEDDVAQGGRYEQQVLLYVAMARDSGFSPTKAEVRPLGRAARAVELSDERLTAVVDEAHAQIARYNEAVKQGRPVDLATPSESSCSWCPFIVDCPAVWTDSPPDLGDLAVVEGEVETVQVLTSSLALRVRTKAGSVTASGLPTADISGRRPAPGDRVRLTGLRQATPGWMRSHPGRALMSVL